MAIFPLLFLFGLDVNRLTTIRLLTLIVAIRGQWVCYTTLCDVTVLRLCSRKVPLASS